MTHSQCVSMQKIKKIKMDLNEKHIDERVIYIFIYI